MKEDRQDLTTGSIWGKMLFFSIPLVLTNFLQVLFNMADIAVIGQFAGSLSLGAVGSTTTLVTLFTGFLIGMGGGTNVLVARFFGAKDKESTIKTIHTALLVSMAAGDDRTDLWTALFKGNSGAVEYQGRTSGWCSTVYKDLFSGNAGNGSL